MQTGQRPLKRLRVDSIPSQIDHSMSTSRSRRFIYTPMKDSRAQIRLLHVEGLQDDRLKFSICDWYLKEAPEYIAISYTWGPVLMRSVIINDSLLDVRTNCRYALWQASRNPTTKYIWVDSICINQDDNEEKSAQVAMMHKIYRRAKEVNACLGHHQDDSERLFAIMSAMAPLIDAAGRFVPDLMHSEQVRRVFNHADLVNHSGNVVRAAPVWRSIFVTLGSSASTEIVNMLKALERRPYWKRLWIQQEIFAGWDTGNLKFFSGRHSVLGRDLKSFLYMLEVVESDLSFPSVFSDELDEDSTNFRYLTKITTAKLPRIWLTNVFTDFGEDYLCFDKRDRLFGLLSLVRREDKKALGVIVDYKRSPMDLALQVASCFSLSDFKAFPAMLSAFGLTAENVEMKTLVAGQCQSSTSTLTSSSIPGVIADTAIIQTLSVRWAARLASGAEGSLQINTNYFVTRRAPPGMAEDIAPDGHIPTLKRYSALLSERNCSNSMPTPKQVTSFDGKVIALITGAAQPGDIMLEFLLPSQGSMDQFLVLRPSQTDSNSFDIIGQGFLLYRYNLFFDDLQECHCDDAEKAEHDFFGAKLTMDLSARDVLAYIGQDCAGWDRLDERHWRFRAADRVDRLYRTPLRRQSKAVGLSISTCRGHKDAIEVMDGDGEEEINEETNAEESGEEESCEEHSNEAQQIATQSGQQNSEDEFEDSGPDEDVRYMTTPTPTSSSECSEDEDTSRLPLSERYRLRQMKMWERR